MSAVALRPGGDVDVAGLVSAIRAASSLSEARDARAKIEAARAWAKVHGEAKRLRLQILRLEVEALVRIFELGGAEIVTPREWRAAEWLAALSVRDRETLVADAPGNITTAAGLAQQLIREEGARRDWRREWKRGVAIASGEAAVPPSIDSQYATNVRKSLADALDEYAEMGEPFTVSDMADEVVASLGVGGQVFDHPALREGVREVCRKAIMSAEIRDFDGVPIPRFITAVEGDTYVRIPTMNATVGQLARMADLRREQLRQDAAALAELDNLHARLVAAGADGDSKIAAVIARPR